MRLRPCGNNILVKMDPDSDKVADGLLFKPEGAYDSILRTGEVIDVGPGAISPKNGERVPTGVEKGDGVVFNRFIAGHTKTAEALHQFTLSKDEAIIKPNDVLLVYDRKDPPKIE